MTVVGLCAVLSAWVLLVEMVEWRVANDESGGGEEGDRKLGGASRQASPARMDGNQHAASCPKSLAVWTRD